MGDAPARDGGGGGAEADPSPAEVEVEHWRAVALEREAELKRLTRRPLVRAALALDRRVEPGRRSFGAYRRRWDAAIKRGLLAAAAIPARAGRDARHTALLAGVASIPPQAPSSRRVSVVGAALPAGAWTAGSTAEPEVVATLAAATGDVVCFVPATPEPLADGWLTRLVDALGADVVAATPTLVHPGRTVRAATEYDWLVRSAGFDIDVDGSGAPVALARHAGRPVDPASAPEAVIAATLAFLAVDRAALDAAEPAAAPESADTGRAPDLDAAGVDLCARLRARGGRIVHVPAAVVLDDRPVLSRAALQQPIDAGAARWRATVERHGPAFVRAARDTRGEPAVTRWVITTAAPSMKVAHRWGDWHLAEGLAAALSRLGHDVDVQTHDRADSLPSRSHDVQLVLRGLAPVRRTRGQSHVLWIISHPEALDIEECDAADLVLVASERFAADLRERTSTPVEVLLQATDPERFRPVPPDPEHRHPVTVVAKTRGVLRPCVADALAAGIRPAIYGGGWRGLVDPDLVVADHVENDLLPTVYCSAGVVLNDHWDTMKSWGFVSNRVFDVLACGVPIVSDELVEIDGLFGDAVPMYREPADLGRLVGRALADPDDARAAAARGRERVLAGHTFDHRARQLVDSATSHGLLPPVR